MSAPRVYLDHNATAPLRPEARAAMAAAMDVAGNPSSVHAEGRAAKALVERVRAQVAEATGAGEADIVLTSGATEGAALALAGRGLVGAPIEHDAVAGWIEPALAVGTDGRVRVEAPERSTLQLANSETGIVQDLPAGLAASDVTQGIGRLPFSYQWSGIGMAILSAHKFGGPKGAGALILPRGAELDARQRGGGQEMGRRSGTENVIGLAGMGAAIEAAMRDLADGVWERVAGLRDLLEGAIASDAPDTTFVGKGGARLPNTTMMVTPGWKGETQVMGMDLAGFAVSAGSACSSGKVRRSPVLEALGIEAADCGLRVSLGPETTEEDIMRFAEAWGAKRKRLRPRAA
ncbi:cysteine desulfurase family protein [Wenxinia saemankumensis]|uniref:Cysteine desulfurase n=1 Tax=Wenxinia saemankumensis TaxID=1447782 RepID=A0A1M6H327_9RHOB|nr:aminotransferase class V-fold PLP-dependent enzyme [Wenxinia saemankumensis]SHJ16611.1 cysteine desulfurase [Wenxinia saemankumensis]